MGKYTTYNEPWVDEEIERHIKIAADKIKAHLPQVLSIFLVGGFGRGEGSVRLEKEQKKIIPINDYDLYLIAEKPIEEDRLNKTAKEIEKEAGSRGYSLYGYSEKEFYFDFQRFLQEDTPAIFLYYPYRYTVTYKNAKENLAKLHKL